MKSKKLTKDRVVELLKDGWEFGLSNNASGWSAWLQRKLMYGGDSHNVNLRSFEALRITGTIGMLPRKKGDPFWLTRYGLKAK